jgi:hypothetical protein
VVKSDKCFQVRNCVLTADLNDQLFSWMQSMCGGANNNSRMPSETEIAVQTQILEALDTDVESSNPTALLKRCWEGLGEEPEKFCARSDRWKVWSSTSGIILMLVVD